MKLDSVIKIEYSKSKWEGHGDDPQCHHMAHTGAPGHQDRPAEVS